MSREEILAKLSVILGDALDLDHVQLTEASTAEEYEDWDSVNHVRLLIGAEQAFGIEFATTEVGLVKNVGQLVDLIEAKQKSR